MKLADLEFTPSFDLPAPAVLYRIQRIRARRGSMRVGRVLLPPADLLGGRFDIAGVAVGYFAEAPETAVYESLCRREATSVSLRTASLRTLLCLRTTQILNLLDLRMHASSWPVLQSLRLRHTQELAADAHAHGFAGIVYCSAQQHNMHCYALFGDPLNSLRAVWSEHLTEPGTGNLHTVLAGAIKGSQVPLVP
ncbi:RES family NAD+ phosphorylase [Roseateles sp. BYS87W]|uniref:RES family NAD+ phosphorylase n=1 Tax=Pelomonas baiyunensis TaxID=3299026 RepID=A0ABW7GTP9_9BURK